MNIFVPVSPERHDLLLDDHLLPGGSGLLLRLLRQGVPVCCLSEFVEPPDEREVFPLKYSISLTLLLVRRTKHMYTVWHPVSHDILSSIF